jgi:hypothetical protein
MDGGQGGSYFDGLNPRYVVMSRFTGIYHGVTGIYHGFTGIYHAWLIQVGSPPFHIYLYNYIVFF